MQLFGCPSTWSAWARAFYGSKLSLLLAGSCVLGGGAVGCSVACDVWGGIACAVLGCCVGDQGQAEWGGALGSCSPGAAAAHAGLSCGFVGVDLEICLDRFFDHTGERLCL